MLFLKKTSIRNKLTLLFLKISVVLILLTQTTLFIHEYFTFRDATKRRISTLAKIIADNSTAALAFNNKEDAYEILAALKTEKYITMTCLYTAKGEIFSTFPKNTPPDKFPLHPENKDFYFEQAYLAGFQPVMEKNIKLGTLYIKYDMGNIIYQWFLGRAGIYLIITVIVLYIGYGLSNKLQNQISQPILALAGIAETISTHKDYSVRAVKQSDDELGKLTDAFNNMLIQIETQNQVLQESEERFRLAIKSAPNGIIMVDGNGTITLLNAQIEKYFGYKNNELIGQPVEILLPEKFHNKHPVLRKKFLDKPEARPMGAGRDLYAIRKDGSEFPVEIGLTSIRTKAGLEVMAVVMDITEHNQALEALKASEERFRSTLDNMLEGCQIIGFDWRYIYINKTAEKHNRRPKEELLGQKYMDMWPGIEKTEVFDVIKQCLEKRINYTMENKFIYPDGLEGWFKFSIQAIPEGVFILSENITDRKNAQNKILKLNDELDQKIVKRTAQLQAANKELESFSYSVSHDLRAPLRAISGFSLKLQRTCENALDDEGKRLIQVVVDNTTKMGQLIDDLLAFSRLGKKEISYTKIDMQILAREVINELIPENPYYESKIKLKKLPAAQGDRAMLKQVFYNLLSNAIKFSANKADPQIEVGHKKKNGESIYYVKDNGAGFNMLHVNKLFGVFQRLHSEKEFKGTGIGLSLIQRIISRHGGRIWAQGEENIGAVFSFTLPRRRKFNEL